MRSRFCLLALLVAVIHHAIKRKNAR
ncbi:MAG: hypothetical protein ACJAW2_002199, partial [Shewanella sp.]